MLVVMNSHASEKDIQRVAMFIESKGFEARVSHGEARTVVHAIGVKEVDQRDFELLHGVDEVIRLTTNMTAMEISRIGVRIFPTISTILLGLAHSR